MVEKTRKVLVVFGSKSDADVYKPIVKKLSDLKVNHILRVCSAHRTPDELKKILAEDAEHDYTCIISGAGLAAHLPGVVASKTYKPVIGVPVHSNYKGLDAFLSIMQMPPGIPVMAVGVNNSYEAALNAMKMHTQYEYINLIGDEDEEHVKKARKILEKFEATIKYSRNIDTDAINIDFIGLDQKPKETEGLVIYCPINKEKHDIEYAINLLEHAKKGLWVGLNRADNAAIAAIEMMNLDHRYDLMLEKYRKEQAESVKEHDDQEKLMKVFEKE